jgi:Tfp pilus assembly protein PilN
MLKINFAPDEYIQKKQSIHMNRVCLVMFVFLMCILTGMFVLIKVRQRSIAHEVTEVNLMMQQGAEAIKQLEELQAKRKMMMNTALITAELIEPVPRSVILASLTNNLPGGVSLTQLKLFQRELKRVANTNGYSNKFEARKATIQPDSEANNERRSETSVELQGIAASNIQVAAYIERLSSSSLFEGVALIHSKERTISGEKCLEFKLTAMLSRQAELTRGDMVSIKQAGSRL